MGYGRICCKLVLAVLVPTDATVQRNEENETYTLNNTVTLPFTHNVPAMTDDLMLLNYGVDDDVHHYIACGRTYLGGGIWNDGGDVRVEDMTVDIQYFEDTLRPKLQALQDKLGWPREKPTFKTFMSYGYMLY
jgi:hypothetical protein